MTVFLAGCSDSTTKPNETADASSTNLDADRDASSPGAPDASDASRASSVTPAPEGAPYQTLDEWHLFTDAVNQAPMAGVVPYDVISPLFSDYATKYRFIYLPKGTKMKYDPTNTWTFPVGAILVKTFSYLNDARDPNKGQRLLETRLFVHQSDGWTPQTYVWSAAQTEAVRTTGGATIQSTFIDPSGRTLTNGYLVPSLNDCRNCHGKLGVTNTLGGRTLQLDRDHDYGSGPENQIDHMASLGMFETAPEPASARAHLVDPFGSSPLYDRVRSYFMGNCAHCHQPGQFAASPSGLWLDYASTDPSQSTSNVGVCKQPSAAGGATCGRSLDVIPGKPNQSIIMCRMESTLAKVKMPPIGRILVHQEGAALLREWIAGLHGECGTPKPPVDGGAPSDAGPGADR